MIHVKRVIINKDVECIWQFSLPFSSIESKNHKIDTNI